MLKWVETDDTYYNSKKDRELPIRDIEGNPRVSHVLQIGEGLTKFKVKITPVRPGLQFMIAINGGYGVHSMFNGSLPEAKDFAIRTTLNEHINELKKTITEYDKILGGDK